MTNKVLLSLATVALFAATAQATTVETTNPWFTTEANAANWTGEGVVVSNGTGVVCVDTAADNAATNTISRVPTGVSNVRITGRIANLCLNASVPAEYSGTLPQASITAVDGATDAWYVWHCTNTTQGAWVQMTGATPEEGGAYNITIEFKNGYVRYAVGKAWLENNANSWITNAQDFAAITKVGLAGFGQFGEVAGLTFESFDITITPSDEDFVSKYDLDITGASTPDQVKAALDAVGDNGYTKWQSIVLGLKDSASQPYIAPVQNTDPNKVTLSLGGVSPKEGYNVTYEVETYDRLDGDMKETTGTINAGGTVDVTPDNSAVKYYKIKIKITK